MFPTSNEFESEFTLENTATPLPEEPPFHVLLLGDWSGNSTRKSLNDRRPIVVDRDNFDAVLKKLNVELDLDLQGEGKTFCIFNLRSLTIFIPIIFSGTFRCFPICAMSAAVWQIQRPSTQPRMKFAHGSMLRIKL